MVSNKSDIGEKNSKVLVQAIADRIAAARLHQIKTENPDTSSANIDISAQDDNILTLKTDGYYVPAVKISEQPGNILQKLIDGYYVKDIPDNLLTTIDYARIDDKVEIYNRILQTQIEILTSSVNAAFLSETKKATYNFEGNNENEELVFDLSSQYNDLTVAILNNELLIYNDSMKNCSIRIKEHGIETMQTIIEPKESQKYVLSNVIDMQIYIAGTYQLFSDITYVNLI